MKPEFTQREAEVLELLGEGKAFTEISIQLGISYSRVINIANNLLHKSGFKSKNELRANAKTLEYEVKD